MKNIQHNAGMNQMLIELYLPLLKFFEQKG